MSARLSAETQPEHLANLFGSISMLRLRPRFARAEGLTGWHSSSRRGESVEFSEYRPYFPGAEPRFIDWKRFAKTDRLYIKSFQDERAARFLFVLDDSASMDVPEPAHAPTKRAFAGQALAALVYLSAVRQKDPTAFVRLSDWTSATPPDAIHRAAGLSRVLADLGDSAARAARPNDRRSGAAKPKLSLADALNTLTICRGTVIIVLSDLYEPADPLQLAALRLRKTGNETWFLHVMTPDEVNLHGSEMTQYVDAETGESMSMVPDRVRRRVRDAFQAHLDNLRRLAAHGRYTLGWANKDPALALKEFLKD